MQFKIIGANADSGDDVDVMLEATSEADVQKIAHDKGIMVASIVPLSSAHKKEDLSAISLVDDEPAPGHAAGSPGTHAPAAGNGHPPERPHGIITTSANTPGDKSHSGEGQIAAEKHNETVTQYHIIMNQSLYLLETSVNKHLKDGWEVTGSLSVGMSNNALQFFQSMIKRPKPA